MADISNKTLAALMVVAIVVSLGGLFISLDRLSKLGLVPQGAPGITGAATTGSGLANVTIVATASIVLDDNDVFFGNCSLGGGADLILQSNASDTADTSYLSDAGNNSMNSPNSTSTSYCIAGGKNRNGRGPDNMTVRNDGNTDVNVTLTSSQTSTSLFSTADAKKFLGFRSANGTNCLNCNNNNGCGLNNWTTTTPHGSVLSVNYTGNSINFTEITSNSASYIVCQNLSYGATNNSVFVFFRMYVPVTEPAGVKSTTITFTGAALSP